MTEFRVVIASRLFPPEVSAAAFRLGALGRALAQEGADVVVLTTRPPKGLDSQGDDAGVEIRRWPVLRDAGGNVRGYLQYASFDAPLLLRLLTKTFDVAVAESPPTTGLVVSLVSRLKRRRFVYYAADVWTDGVISMGAPSAVVSLMRRMEQAVLRRADAVISVSDEVTERLVLLGADPSRITTVGNGIDTDVFEPDATPADPGAEYFVYTGTMSEWQRPDIFIRAFAQVASDHPGLRLKFFGQGVLEDELKDIAGELVPGRVDFGGVVSPRIAAQWIRGAVASLVSIVPGIGYDFARPTKSYAAAATGTPVLFAGPEAGARLIREANLGRAVDFAVDAVARGMRELLGESITGVSDRLRGERASWARENVSLTAVAARAASVIAQVPGRSIGRLDTGPSQNSDRGRMPKP